MVEVKYDNWGLLWGLSLDISQFLLGDSLSQIRLDQLHGAKIFDRL